VLVIGFTVAGCFSVFLRYEIIGTGYLPRGAVALMLGLVAANGVLRGAKWLRIRPLTAQELLLVFLLLLVVGAIAGQEYAQHFYLNIIGIVYYATPDIAPPELYLQDLNHLLLPTNDPMSPVAVWAHEGLPPGRSIPWRAWVTPLLVWTPFFLAVYFMVLCFAATLAWRWEREERLLYPLVEVPLEVVHGEPNQYSSIFSDPLFWLAFALPCIHYTIKGLHGYWPTIPYVNLEPRLQTRFAGPWAAFNGILMYIRFDMIGIAYLLAGEVGFSLWFFFFLRRIQQFIRLSFGVRTSHYEFFRFQSFGGFLLLAVALLYSARQHLRRAIARAFGMPEDASSAPDRGEPYRVGVLGFIGAFAFVVWWCSYFGMNTVWAIVEYTLFPIVGMVVARVISEAGMFIYSAPFGGYTAGYNEMLFRIFGAQRIGATNVAMLTMTSWCQIRSTATQNMASVFGAYRIGSRMGARRLNIMLLALAAIALAILASHITAPYVIYTWGVPKLASWPSKSALNATNSLARLIQTPTEMTGESWFALALGAATTWVLFALRRQYVWWPLHPLGFVTWLGWPIDRYWTSILIGWLIKVIVTQLGGFRIFRRVRPAAFGLILGMNVIFTIWLLIHFIWPGPLAIMID